MEICVIERGGTVAPFLRLTGEAATGLPQLGNELTGVVFDPTGRRMYFAAQRAFGLGAVYEVTGPFRGVGRARAPVAAGLTPDANDPPGLRVRVRRRISLRALRRGLVVEIRVDGPALLRVALRTDDLKSVPGKRGSTGAAVHGHARAAPSADRRRDPAAARLASARRRRGALRAAARAARSSGGLGFRGLAASPA